MCKPQPANIQAEAPPKTVRPLCYGDIVSDAQGVIAIIQADHERVPPEFVVFTVDGPISTIAHYKLDRLSLPVTRIGYRKDYVVIPDVSGTVFATLPDASAIMYDWQL